VIISSGKVVAEGKPESLVGHVPKATTVRFRLPNGSALPESLRSKANVNGPDIVMETLDPTTTLFELTSWAVEQALTLEGFEVIRPSLEDVYLSITEGAAGVES